MQQSHYTNSAQPCLATSHFQDWHLHPQHCSCISIQVLHLRGKHQRLPTATARNHWIYSVSIRANINQTAEFCFISFHTIKHIAIYPAWKQPVSEHIWMVDKNVSIWTKRNSFQQCCAGLWFSYMFALTYLLQLDLYSMHKTTCIIRMSLPMPLQHQVSFIWRDMKKNIKVTL